MSIFYGQKQKMSRKLCPCDSLMGKIIISISEYNFEKTHGIHTISIGHADYQIMQ